MAYFPEDSNPGRLDKSRPLYPLDQHHHGPEQQVFGRSNSQSNPVSQAIFCQSRTFYSITIIQISLLSNSTYREFDKSVDNSKKVAVDPSVVVTFASKLFFVEKRQKRFVSPKPCFRPTSNAAYLKKVNIIHLKGWDRFNEWLSCKFYARKSEEDM